MIKIRYIFLAIFWSSFISSAQKDVNLTLNHTFQGQPFQYGVNYDFNGEIVSFSRVKYYLSGLELIHDGGQTLILPDTYVLASANISNYPLGMHILNTVEGFSFDLGVDSVRNGMGTSNWPSGHPLSAQTPSMDWSWPDGYFFWTIDGRRDSDNDGDPDQHFQLHGMGNHLLTPVDPFSGLNVTGATINLELYVEISDWLREMNLQYVGIAHDGLHDNMKVSENTNYYNVFTLNSELGLDEEALPVNNIYTDYTVPYAPTIYYNLETTERIRATVYNASGQIVFEVTEMEPEGNFFIRKELPDGHYFCKFENSQISKQHRFKVVN